MMDEDKKTGIVEYLWDQLLLDEPVIRKKLFLGL